jgi:uncharacterized peroxidase-related enzyme
MARLAPLPADQLPDELQPLLAFARETMGFTPNDVLTMAHWPALLQAMAPLVGVVYSPGRVPMELKRLAAMVASAAAGCQYCVAHNALGLEQDGVSPEKQAAVWEFDTHPAFTPGERAALGYARAAAQVPAAVTDEGFAQLRDHFDDRPILELTAVIALFGFLNRWNASLGTALEPQPLGFARNRLGAWGWKPGVHGGGQAD